MEKAPALSLLVRIPAAAIALGLAGAGCHAEPIARALIVAGLLLYGGILWRWPIAWLVAVPALVASLDLAFWTGRLTIEEPDLVVLVTIAVLALRAPPTRRDFTVRSVGGTAIALATLATSLGLVRGLLVPGPAGGSSMIELEPADAIRVAKGFFAALALLPFLRNAWRTQERAPVLFGAGMAAGLAIVAAAAIHERFVFTGLWNFTAPYRIVATFSDMHLGGGFLGAYVVLALPFVFRLMSSRAAVAMTCLFAVAAGGLYTLVVTFARGAYGSAIVSNAVLLLGWLRSDRKAPRGATTLVLPAALLCVVGGAIAYSATTTPVMEFRLALAARDLDERLALWSEGLGLRGRGVGTTLFGTGLGTYARTVLAREPSSDAPGNFVLRSEDGRHFLALEGGLPLYVGQRVDVGPDATYRLSFALRAAGDYGPIVASLCEKVLLYSTHCQSAEAWPRRDGAWVDYSAELLSDGIGSGSRFRALRRPVELALFVRRPGSIVDVTNVRLRDGAARNLIANGDFSQGMAHWFYTDDVHTVWRIENQYLMSVFEEGAVGLAALLFLVGTALWRSLGAIRAGAAMAPAYAASLVAFLASSLFDCPLEVPRLATLVYLIAFVAITAGEAPLRPVSGPQTPDRRQQ
ncbi:MAG TPA: hypothetical protein VL993_17605 [Stellaceae bacterium]|nr:hypothetical protein [Stellaceae bacterium]